MIEVPQMLMIGSAGRNSGKTEFACSVIKKFRGVHDIVGVKVTAVEEREGECPRGGEGCGVCSDLQGNYLITEEADEGRGKDTERLVAAGASRVYWLRVLKEHLEEGRDALFSAIGPNALIICESNSLRTTVDPGLFLMFRHQDSLSYKASAESVLEHADRVVTFSGTGLEARPETTPASQRPHNIDPQQRNYESFLAGPPPKTPFQARALDLDLDAIDIVDGQWTLRSSATAIILAGGKSERMQQDKGLLPIHGRPMIEHIRDQLRPHVAQMLVSANDRERYAFLNLPVIPDAEQGLGPMMGIISALEASESDLNLCIACDIPHVDAPLLRRMLREARGYDAVVPVVEGGHMEPLFAVYRKTMLPFFKEALSQGVNKIIDAFPTRNINYLHLGDTHPIKNLNTRQDYNNFVIHRAPH